MADYNELNRRVRERRRQLDQRAGEVRSIVLRVKSVEAEAAQLRHTAEVLEKVGLLLTSIGEARQNAAQSAIEQLVTRGLQTIFDSSLSFHLVSSTRASSAQIDFIVRTTLPNGEQIDTSVMEARGGGLAATVGFLLRLIIMLLRNGASRENILLLDETFAHVSDDYLERLGEFLREIVDKTGVQIIMVTHQRTFAEYADVVYAFSQDGGDTRVERVS